MPSSWAGQPEVGRAAYLQSPSALRLADVAQQHSTLLLEWVVSPFYNLGTDMWAFKLNLVPSGSIEMFALFWNLMNMSQCSNENIGPMYVEVSGRSARNVPGGRDFL